MVKWDNEAQRKRITRQRNDLISKLKSFNPNDPDYDAGKHHFLREELKTLEDKYFQPGRENSRQYYTAKGALTLYEKDQAGKVAYKSRASISAERRAVYRYRHNLTLSEEQMRIIKYLRLTKSRYEFDKFVGRR